MANVTAQLSNGFSIFGWTTLNNYPSSIYVYSKWNAEVIDLFMCSVQILCNRYNAESIWGLYLPQPLYIGVGPFIKRVTLPKGGGGEPCATDSDAGTGSVWLCLASCTAVPTWGLLQCTHSCTARHFYYSTHVQYDISEYAIPFMCNRISSTVRTSSTA